MCLCVVCYVTMNPQVGHEVVVVNGRGRGCRATLIQIDDESLTGRIRFLEGALHGSEVDRVEFEDLCKFDSSKLNNS